MMVLGTALSCGDAVCTIAAQTSAGTEFFVTDATRGRLSFHQRNFAGNRYSDHLAALNAFQAWEEARQGGEEAEIGFCDHRGLNMPTLRTTWEAKRQLRDLLVAAGFPEECLMPQVYNFSGPDAKLDLVVGLLALGSYPNVCLHREKRKVLTTEAKAALIHKSSVNCVRDVQFPVPFFVFGEKIRTRAVACKQMTMVSPLHLLLFASRRVDLVDAEAGTVRLDNWINLKMDPHAAAVLTAFRPAVETLVIRAAQEPDTVNALNSREEQAVQALRQLSKMNTARHGMDPVGMGGFQTRRPPRHFGDDDGGSGPPPAKQPSGFNRMFGGRGYGGGPPRGGGFGGFGGGRGFRGGPRGGYRGGRGGWGGGY